MMHIQKRREPRGGLQHTDEARAKMVEAAAQRRAEREFGRSLLSILNHRRSVTITISPSDSGPEIIIEHADG